MLSGHALLGVQGLACGLHLWVPGRPIFYWSWVAYVFTIPYFRYLDIGLGLVLFSSSISLVYAGYSESKAWLVVFTSGSLAVLIFFGSLANLILFLSWAAYAAIIPYFRCLDIG